MSPLWFVSDVHISSSQDSKAKVFLSFINRLGRDLSAGSLWILGDLFDLWVGSHSFWFKKYSEIVNGLVDLASRGVKVGYLQGNHDVASGRFWESHGISYFNYDYFFESCYGKIYLTHGDFINPQEKLYHDYVYFLKSKRAQKIADLIPAEFWNRVGTWASQKSRKRSFQMRSEKAQKIRSDFKDFAIKKRREYSYSYLIAGHIHLCILEEIEKNCWAINLGSWLELPRSLLIDASGPRFIEL